MFKTFVLPAEYWESVIVAFPDLFLSILIFAGSNFRATFVFREIHANYNTAKYRLYSIQFVCVSGAPLWVPGYHATGREFSLPKLPVSVQHRLDNGHLRGFGQASLLRLSCTIGRHWVSLEKERERDREIERDREREWERERERERETDGQDKVAATHCQLWRER